jgi:hypothetical protein
MRIAAPTIDDERGAGRGAIRAVIAAGTTPPRLRVLGDDELAQRALDGDLHQASGAKQRLLCSGDRAARLRAQPTVVAQPPEQRVRVHQDTHGSSHPQRLGHVGGPVLEVG